MAWTWKDSPELMKNLRTVQNHPAFDNQDIMTIVGFFTSEEELLRHVDYCESRAANYVAPRRRSRKAA